MPAKQNTLPRPCPICGKPNGTIQLVGDRQRNLLVRIGHYNAQNRKLAITKTETYGRAKHDKENYFEVKIAEPYAEEENKRIIKSAERTWCSFRSYSEWSWHFEDQIPMFWERGQPPPKIIRLTAHGKQLLRNRIRMEGWKVRIR